MCSTGPLVKGCLCPSSRSGVSGGGRTREAQRGENEGDGRVEIHRSASVYPPCALITQFCFSPVCATDAAATALGRGVLKYIFIFYFFRPERRRETPRRAQSSSSYCRDPVVSNFKRPTISAKNNTRSISCTMRMFLFPISAVAAHYGFYAIRDNTCYTLTVKRSMYVLLYTIRAHSRDAGLRRGSAIGSREDGAVKLERRRKNP